MNPRLELLQAYPFERWDGIKAKLRSKTNAAHIALSLGEPKHPAPDFLVQALIEPTRITRALGTYPPTRGPDDLRAAIADWCTKRFALSPSTLTGTRHVLPVNGTREALFSFAQAVIQGGADATVVMPNPFYQIYEGAALLAGATPHFVPCPPSHGFTPDFSTVPNDVWAKTQLLYLCSPGNPTGAVLNLDELVGLIKKADEFDFVIAADECYSEIYYNENTPPTGLLEACAHIGRHDFRRCVVFHSLSKRSNLPGLRSGFVAGDADVLARYFQYRTYHGGAMAMHVAEVSAIAWRDEAHVIANRQMYREKYNRVYEILKSCLDVTLPPASFYLWPKTPIDEVEFAARLFEQEQVTVLPGSFLSRPTNQGDPGKQRVRMALVAPLAECIEGAERVKRFVSSL